MKKLAELFEDFTIEFVVDGKIISLRLVDDSIESIRLITKWRRENINWYDSEFSPTELKTKKWLQNNIIGNSNNVLFFILVNGKKVGHIGLDSYNEKLNYVYIMSVVKGENIVFPRLMEYVGKELIEWIFKNLEILIIRIRVFSDNYKAINMNERIGMLTVNSIPMKKTKKNDGFIWKEFDSNCEKILNTIRYMNFMEIKK